MRLLCRLSAPDSHAGNLQSAVNVALVNPRVAGYNPTVETNNEWWSAFLLASSKPTSQSRLTVGILEAIEAEIKSNSKTFRSDVLDSDDFDAVVEDGILNLKGRTLVSVLYATTIDDAMEGIEGTRRCLGRNDAQSALIVMPLLRYEEPTDLTSVRIMGHREIVEIIRRHLGIITRHVKECMRPAILDRLASQTSWKSNRLRHVSALSQAYNLGQLSLFLGAGVSQSAGLPGWRVLLDRLMVDVVRRYFNTFPFQKEQEDVAAQMLTAFSNDSPLISARTIKAALGTEYRSALRNALYPTSGRTKSLLLNEVAQLCKPLKPMAGAKAVVTYNFDDLLEQQLQEERITLPVLHVHGVLSETETREPDAKDPASGEDDRLKEPVLSETRYHDLYANAFSRSNLDQLEFLRNTTCLFIGCSLTDPNQRRLLEIAARTGRGIRHYAILQRRKLEGGPQRLDSNDNVIDLILDAHHRIQEVSFGTLGVEILWVEEHEETPGLLNQIRTCQPSLFATP